MAPMARIAMLESHGPADAQLVFNRRLALIAGGIAGIQDNAGHRRLALCSSQSAAHRAALVLASQLDESGFDLRE
jgi:hypothetical protein